MIVEAVFESLMPPIKHPSPGTEIAAPTHLLETILLEWSLLAAFCSLFFVVVVHIVLGLSQCVLLLYYSSDSRGFQDCIF
jgi:hypothetical protein